MFHDEYLAVILSEGIQRSEQIGLRKISAIISVEGGVDFCLESNFLVQVLVLVYRQPTRIPPDIVDTLVSSDPQQPYLESVAIP
jgi:hypothetical protein